VVKVAIIFFILSQILNASLLDYKIREYIGDTQYKIHQNLIQILFKKSQLFYIDDSKLNIVKILRVLKSNGLINQQFDKPQTFRLELYTNANYKMFIKIALDSLRELGYTYVIIDNIVKIDTDFKVVFKFQSEYILDPMRFNDELLNRSAKIINIDKFKDNHWRYYIDSTTLALSDTVELDAMFKNIKLDKPIRDYYIHIIDKSIEYLIFKSFLANRWFPIISMYDKNMNLIKNVQFNDIMFDMRVDITPDIEYIRVSDMYTLNNLKRGLRLKAIRVNDED